MNLSLTPDTEALINLKVESGRYRSASDVIVEALRLMDERDRLHEHQKGSIREKIAAGMASLRAGQHVDGERIMDAIDAELEAQEHHALP